MRKKVTVGFAVSIALFVIVIVTLIMLSRSQRFLLMQAPPLTVSEVHSLSPTQAIESAPAQPTGVAAHAGPGDKSPPPLARAVTRKELLQSLGADKRHVRLEARATFLLCDTLATACAMAQLKNQTGGWYWEAAQEAEKMADPDTAEAYYREALDYPLDDTMRAYCLSRLAWYQEDPEVAAALLEESVGFEGSPSQPTWLAQAVYFADRTGSRETREYYLARLQEVLPEMARDLAQELDLESPRPTEKALIVAAD